MSYIRSQVNLAEQPETPSRDIDETSVIKPYFPIVYRSTRVGRITYNFVGEQSR